jgi:hypothetical protein
MLYITKIIEGGIDLMTQQELPRSLVVSNGDREIVIPVNDNVIAEVVELFAENGGPQNQNIPVADVPSAQTPNTSRAAADANRAQRPPPSPQPVNQAPNPFEEEEEGPQMVPDEEGFEPGEAFNDIGTGAGSL